MASVIQAAQAKLMAAWSDGPVQEAGFGGIGKMLLDILMKMLGDCTASTESIKDEKDADFEEFFVRRAVRQELRERYGFGGYARQNGDRMVSTILKARKSATVEEIDQLRSLAA